jgi:CRISPR-associated protein Csd1
MTVLQALDRYYERMSARGEAEAPGFSREKISFAVVLSPDGEPIDKQDLRETVGKRIVPRLLEVPAAVNRRSNIKANLFWDKTEYSLGCTVEPDNKTGERYVAFKVLHLKLLAGTSDTGLLALKRFLEGWTPERFDVSPFVPEMLDTNVVFRLEGERGFIHQREAAIRLVEAETGGDEPRAFCLITGEEAPIRRLHPTIKGVEGAQSSGAALVSFNLDAFTSYGQAQGANAPTSEAAAFRYGAALNRMLDRNSRNRIARPIGDTSVVFWADASGVGEEAAKAAEDAFADLFAPPAETGNLEQDKSEAAKLRDKLDEVAKGRPVSVLDPRLRCGTRFYVLGLAPNAARLSVRYWLEDTFDAFARRLAEHYRDLAIEPTPWRATPPSIQRLLVRTTALQEKFDNIPPLLAGEVARAVLGGTTYPRTLLATAIVRLRAGDDPRSGWHAAVLKACLNRAHRFAHPKAKEPLSVSLNPDTPSPAYQLGRLFAVLESAQYAALGRVNTSIVDRYYGAASSTPARVFGALMRGAQTHISDARKRGRGLWIESRLTEIIGRLPADLPTSLRIEDQARFAVGYYHERGSGQARTRAQAETTEELHTPDVETDR